MSRAICVQLYEAIVHLRPAWYHEEDDQDKAQPGDQRFWEFNMTFANKTLDMAAFAAAIQAGDKVVAKRGDHILARGRIVRYREKGHWEYQLDSMLNTWFAHELLVGDAG